jgi:hypothetical protein
MQRERESHASLTPAHVNAITLVDKPIRDSAHCTAIHKPMTAENAIHPDHLQTTMRAGEHPVTDLRHPVLAYPASNLPWPAIDSTSSLRPQSQPVGRPVAA